MEPNHKLTLYISYYLARFNNEALANLGYNTWNAAFDDISNRLKVKSHSVKNWRDEFDPLFEHRVGWYQRPMTPSRVKVAQALESLDEVQIREIVKDILSGKLKNEPDEEELLLNIVSDDKEQTNRKFILRTPTGRAAEEFFIKHYAETNSPVPGALHDCRDLGCGYDFKITSGTNETYIEVKGLAEISGGILFTDKEWRTAKENSENYILCIVKNIPGNPTICFISNPAKKIKAKKNIYTTIQINWSVTENQLENIND
jgi:hypothetical protein